jgi:uncharacterized membrane protein
MLTIMLKLLTAFAFVIVTAGPIWAQPEPSPTQQHKIKEENEKRLEQELNKGPSSTPNNGTTPTDPYGFLAPQPPQEIPQSIEPAVKEKLKAAQMAYYDYRADGLRHRGRVFMWQFISSIVIFVVVLMLVGVGIYFSWVQFTASQPKDARTKKRRHSRTLRDKTPMNDAEKQATNPIAASAVSETSQTMTEIQASLQGIKVSSPVLGVIILIISFLFFYLYLVHVYPINDVF